LKRLQGQVDRVAQGVEPLNARSLAGRMGTLLVP